MSSKSKDTDDGLDRDLVFFDRITVDMIRVHVHRENINTSVVTAWVTGH